jgi:hypothetical protein
MQSMATGAVAVVSSSSGGKGKFFRSELAATVGTTVEWYDFQIYGLAAALVFNNQFFPSVDPVAGTLLAFATFAVGFLARPIGAAIFGHLGDRIGRKSTLITTFTDADASDPCCKSFPRLHRTPPRWVRWIDLLRCALGIVEERSISQPCLPESCSDFSATFTTIAVDNSSLRWLEISTDCRPRRTFLHLSYSCATPFGSAILVTQDPSRTLAVNFAVMHNHDAAPTILWFRPRILLLFLAKRRAGSAEMAMRTCNTWRPVF